ncbi:hypothetical protein K474DRAFT_1668977 [Panus rudis PR-1116 ss-1]|nr:hypothetical protein K474DRAFT_1668977 [Panus rudis PR-1116 ss-1]
MDNELGDDYIRRIAAFIRANEHGLAAATLIRKRPRKGANASDPAPTSFLNPLGWFTGGESGPATASAKPVILSFDVHHLFYLLMRMEAIGLDVGSLDVRVENPSRPMNYVNVFQGTDRSDALSLRSFATTFSAVSKLSLGAPWWGRPAPPTVDQELKFIYSSFTKIPTLSLHAPEPRMIAELANEAPNENAVPLDVFKNLQSLECVDIDPRTIIGWDRLAESLIRLTIKKSGLEDISDVFVGAVMDDQARREGRAGTDRLRRIPKPPPSRQSSFYSTRLPDTVPEDPEDTPEDTNTISDSPTDLSVPEKVPDADDTPMPTPKRELPSLKWAFLRQLCLADNALTFLPSAPLSYLTSLTHLDLSSNLLVSVPAGLSALYNLVSLNLSDNMIDSVLGIYTMLGGVTTLNLSKNRLDNICGLERLLALERVDLRQNVIEESAEIGRLAILPNISEIWVESNPLCEFEEGYRIRIFDLFSKEGKNILLDGTPPTFYEKRYLTSPPPEQMTSSRPVSVAQSPPVVPVGSPSPRVNGLKSIPAKTASPKDSPPTSNPPSHAASPQLAAVRGRKKKNKRIVELDGGSDAGSSRSASHTRVTSEVTNAASAAAAGRRTESPAAKAKPPVPPVEKSTKMPSTQEAPVAGSSKDANPDSPPTATSSSITVVPRVKPVTRHSRHRTELAPATPSSDKQFFDEPQQEDDRRKVAHRRSATMSSKSASRRARVSASVYEPPPDHSNADPNSKTSEGKPFSEAEAFRARIEALRSDMGDGWLKVFNQSHLGSPGVPSS